MLWETFEGFHKVLKMECFTLFEKIILAAAGGWNLRKQGAQDRSWCRGPDNAVWRLIQAAALDRETGR